MSARSKARKRALDILYAAEMRGLDPVAQMDEAIAEGEGPTNPWTDTLVRGVASHRERIDELLTSYSQAWTLDRMPAVDRNLLRMSVGEMIGFKSN
jgi:N utilization substance protein B